MLNSRKSNMIPPKSFSLTVNEKFHRFFPGHIPGLVDISLVKFLRSPRGKNMSSLADMMKLISSNNPANAHTSVSTTNHITTFTNQRLNNTRKLVSVEHVQVLQVHWCCDVSSSFYIKGSVCRIQWWSCMLQRNTPPLPLPFQTWMRTCGSLHLSWKLKRRLVCPVWATVKKKHGSLHKEDPLPMYV